MRVRTLRGSWRVVMEARAGRAGVQASRPIATEHGRGGRRGTAQRDTGGSLDHGARLRGMAARGHVRARTTGDDHGAGTGRGEALGQ